MRILVICIAALCCIQHSWAQKVICKDQTTGLPVSFVFIYNQSHTLSALTDTAGAAEVSEFSKQDTLTFQHPSYENRRVPHSELFDGMRLFLSPDWHQLGDIEISFTPGLMQWEHSEQVINRIAGAQSSRSAAYNTPDLIEKEGGVFVQRSQQGGGSPVIRGFEASRVLAVVDGVRMNNAIYRMGHLQNTMTVDRFTLSSVEIVQGPASSTYGSDALGGAMLFQTISPPRSNTDSLAQVVSTTLRSTSATKERTAHVHYGIGGKRWGVLGSTTLSQMGTLTIGKNHTTGPSDWGTQPYFAAFNGKDTVLTNPTPHSVQGTDYNQRDYLLKVDWSPSHDWKLTANLQRSQSSDISRQDQLNDWNDGLPKYARWDYGPQKRSLQSLNATHFGEVKWLRKVDAILSRQHIEESRITRRYNQEGENHQVEDLTVYQLTLHSQAVISSKKQLKYGIDLHQNLLTSSAYDIDIASNDTTSAISRYPDGKNRYSSGSVFAQYLWVKKRHEWSFGARYNLTKAHSTFTDSLRSEAFSDGINQWFDALSGNINWKFHHKQWAVRSAIASAFRAPNIDDYGKIREKSGEVQIPSFSLKPEQVISYDFGVQRNAKDSAFSVSASGFYTYAWDLLVTRPGEYNGVDSIYYNRAWGSIVSNQNAQLAHIYGFQAWVLYKPISALAIEGMASWQRGRDLADNLPLAHIPPFFARLQTMYLWKEWTAQTSLKYQANKSIDDMDESVDNAEEGLEDGFPAYMLWNVGITYQAMKGLQLHVFCDNMMDVHYRPFASGVSGPGRNFGISMRADL